MTNPFKSLNKANHEYFHSIWKFVQDEDTESLPPEDRLLAKIMIEHEEFSNAMKKNKIPRHERIHCMANILIYLMHDVLRGTSEFDLERYKSLLRRYKEKKPDKIAAALEKEISKEEKPK